MADASLKVVKGAEIVHIGTNSSSIASGGTFSSASPISTALSGTGNLSSYPRCDVALYTSLSASVASTSTNIYLYRRDINIDGTGDAKIPDASNKVLFVGAFTVPASTTVSTTHYMNIVDVPLPGAGDCEFYLENALGVNIPAAWTLKITPKTDAGATA